MNRCAWTLLLTTLPALTAWAADPPARQPAGHGTPAVPGGDAVASPARRLADNDPPVTQTKVELNFGDISGLPPALQEKVRAIQKKAEELGKKYAAQGLSPAQIQQRVMADIQPDIQALEKSAPVQTQPQQPTTQPQAPSKLGDLSGLPPALQAQATAILKRAEELAKKYSAQGLSEAEIQRRVMQDIQPDIQALQKAAAAVPGPPGQPATMPAAAASGPATRKSP